MTKWVLILNQEVDAWFFKDEWSVNKGGKYADLNNFEKYRYYTT